MLLNLQMVMHEPWKASAPEVYLLTTTDGSVPRGLDPNRWLAKSIGWLSWGKNSSLVLLATCLRLEYTYQLLDDVTCHGCIICTHENRPQPPAPARPSFRLSLAGALSALGSSAIQTGKEQATAIAAQGGAKGECARSSVDPDLGWTTHLVAHWKNKQLCVLLQLSDIVTCLIELTNIVYSLYLTWNRPLVVTWLEKRNTCIWRPAVLHGGNSRWWRCDERHGSGGS